MKKVLEWINKHKGMALIIGIIGVPVFVYLLSVLPIFPSGHNNDWAGFWGGYLGALIGAMATISAVTLEIRNSRIQAKADEENRIKPYLHLEPASWNNSKEKEEIEFQGKLHTIGLHAVCNISLYEDDQDDELSQYAAIKWFFLEGMDYEEKQCPYQ